MERNFNDVIERGGTHCVKWEFIRQGEKVVFGDHADAKHGAERLLPLWVADMDFQSPPAVIKTLRDRAEHGIFGYCAPGDSYYEVVLDWMEKRYRWPAERDWIVLTPGVVPAIHIMVQAFVEPGQKVLVQRPVYYPFFDAAERNGVEIVSNSLLYGNGRYRMDFEDLERKTADPAVKMAILCSPHNPVGRVWRAEELARFGEICTANDVLIVSDEVHCDLIYQGQSFTPFGLLDEAIVDNSIICTSPSKSFNLAGLKTSNIFIPDPEKRRKFKKTMLKAGMYGANAFGLVALEAAYKEGEAWLADVMAYVEENYRFMERFVAEEMPQLKIVRPEGTYLVWVDFSALGLEPAERKRLLMEEARVFLDEGELFGPEGADFERFNIACSRVILEEALEKIRNTINN